MSYLLPVMPYLERQAKEEDSCAQVEGCELSIML